MSLRCVREVTRWSVSNHPTVLCLRLFASSSLNTDGNISVPKEFPRIVLNPQFANRGRERKKMDYRRNVAADIMPPRSQRMHVDHDWTNVWPAAATFKPASVPLPIRMGYTKNAAPKDKFGNTELMKIPNFLHLTPAAIKKHCQALKKFCTPWPDELATDQDCQERLPVEIITTDYCHSGQSIRNPRARIVSLRVPLSSFDFDYHARDKFLRLIGNRYDPRSHYFTIITDRCPTKKQNMDYTRYLITALYFESWKTEPWEHEKTASDLEKFFWEGSKSQILAEEILQKRKSTKAPDVKLNEFSSTEELKSSTSTGSADETIEKYKDAVLELLNEGEDINSLKNYKSSVKRLLSIE